MGVKMTGWITMVVNSRVGTNSCFQTVPQILEQTEIWTLALPPFCCLTTMLVILVIVWGSLAVVCLCFCSIHSPFSSIRMPSPQRDVATTVLHCGGGVCWGMGSVRFAPHTGLWILTEKLYLGLISPQNHVPHLSWVTLMLSGQLQACFDMVFLE